MTKQLLVSAVATALGLASVSAAALVDLDTVAEEPILYASEISLENHLFFRDISGAAAMNARTALGFGFAEGNTDIYVRYDLSGGITWGAPLTAADLLNSSGLAAATVSLSAGGGTSDNYVIFNIQAVGVGGLTKDELLTLNLSPKGVQVPSNIKSVVPQIRYRLYNTPVDVVNQTANFLKEKSEPLLKFVPALGIQIAPATRTASVTKGYLEFKDGTNPTNAFTTALDNGIVYGLTTPPAPVDWDGSPVTLATILGPDSTLVVHGDFSVAAALSLQTVQDCDGSGVTLAATALSSDKQTATLPIGNTAGTYYLCYTANGTNPIPREDYTSDFNPVLADATNYNVTGVSGLETGHIVRDGTELQATFVASTQVAGGAVGGVNRFVFSNNGPTDAPIVDIRILTPGVAPLAVDGFSIPAGGNLAIQSSQLIPPGTTRTVVHFTVGAAPQYIKGTYQLVLPGSDVQAVVQMVPPKYSVETE